MTRQVLDLTGLDQQSGWQGAVLLDPAFIVGGGVAYLRYIERVGNSIRVRLGASETDNPLDVGPHFTQAFEAADEAFTFVALTGSTLVLKGPGHPDNTFADLIEPYFWTPDNGAAMAAWFTGRSGAFTLTLDDGVEPSIAVGGTAAAGAAETAATVARVALTLADFDTAGLELDVLALLRAGDGGAGTLFALPPRGVVGAILDGEIGLGADDEIITRIRRRSGAVLAFNDNGPLLLADYFGPGGDGADLTLYVQTTAGVGSLPVSTTTSAGGNFIQFGPLGTDLDALVDGIEDGHRFILAFARAAVTAIAVRGTAAAGAAETAATVARITPPVRPVAGAADAGAAEARTHVRQVPALAIRGLVEAGAAEAAARVLAIRALRGSAAAGAAETTATVARIVPAVRPVAGRAEAGAAEARTHVRQVPALAIRGLADAGGAETTATVARIASAVRPVPPLAIAAAAAGGAEARARLTRIGHLLVHGTAASGAPVLFAHVARVPPAAEQYARTIRESAPERRLLTALEIRHAAVAAPVRVVNDTEERTIEGNRYVALRFDARLADDVEGQAPQAELAIDNVGRDLTQWLEAAQGGTGATVRVLQVLDIDDPPIEWELTMDVAGVQVDAERVTARLGFDPLLGRAAVTLRHDPQTSPGLF